MNKKTTDWLGGPDLLYAQKITTFKDVAQANASALGLGSADLSAISNAQSGFDAALANHLSLRQLALGATSAKTASRKTTAQVFRKYARIIQAKPGVSAQLKAELGLPLHDDQPTPVIPVPPTDLSSVGFANGENRLRWSRNGNQYNTVFIIEARHNDTDEWTIVGTTTRSRFTHNDQIPGRRMYYRIRARRTTHTTAPSDETVVYADVDQSEFQAAA
jgi:hypothetical protein